ncbi:MAG: FKBP-type peptidyl-prolyl cis-trans isomerase [Prevotella sp.]|nr:FKBP-type peptidyl-prolyl cis-trans isomerase [Prevotella sp.]
MENKPNNFISLAYKLYVGGNNEQEMMEEATAERPFQFISGFGFALDAFEANVTGLDAGSEFDFEIPKEQAYGEYSEEHVIDMNRQDFFVDGKFDSEHIYVDAVIPLQNNQGQRFYGRVAEIGQEKVKIDLNHPLAGETLHFVGRILENRPATQQEIQSLINHMSHGGCSGCGGGDCGGGDCGGCGGGGCGGCH